jgi:4-hydroxybenzoate polyprenyltransferase
MVESVDFELSAEQPGAPGAADAAKPGSGAETLPPPPAVVTPVPVHWLRQRLVDLSRLMRLDRPIGIWLLLWPALWALWVAAGGHPQRRLLLIFCLGTVLMRSAGCVINDLIDRDIDPHVRRTSNRPIAARRVAPVEALALFAGLVASAFLLVLQLNPLCLRLSLVGAALTASYPLLKRFFPMPQLYLGLSFGWAVPMAFAATLGEVPRVGWVLMLATVVWAAVYDTFYAMADRPDDLRIGVRSSAITFGDLDLLMVGAMQVLVLLALLFAGRLVNLGTPFYWALAAGAGCFLWQQWVARHRDPDGCMRAFHNNNYFGIVILAGIVLDYATQR